MRPAATATAPLRPKSPQIHVVLCYILLILRCTYDAIGSVPWEHDTVGGVGGGRWAQEGPRRVVSSGSRIFNVTFFTVNKLIAAWATRMTQIH